MAENINRKRFCPNCGIEIGENDKFCGNCGSSIEEDRGYTSYNNLSSEVAVAESIPQNVNEVKKIQFSRPHFSKKVLAYILSGIGSGIVVIAIIVGILLCYTCLLYTSRCV